MKVFTTIIFCVLAALLVSCSCAEQSAGSKGANSSQSADSKSKKPLKNAELGWVKFDIPNDYSVSSKDKVARHYAIRENDIDNSINDNSIHIFLVDKKKGKDMKSVLKEENRKNKGSALKKSFEMGSYTWYPVSDAMGVNRYYAEVDDTHVLKVDAAGGISVKDSPVKIVLKSIGILDLSKYPKEDAKKAAKN